MAGDEEQGKILIVADARIPARIHLTGKIGEHGESVVLEAILSFMNNKFPAGVKMVAKEEANFSIVNRP